MKLYYLSIFLSFICIIVALKSNYAIAIEYQNVMGKDQAFFGLRNLDRFYYAFLGVLAFLIGIFSLAKKERRVLSVLSLLLALLAIVMTFLDLWRLWI